MTVAMLAHDADRASMPGWLINESTVPRMNARMGAKGLDLDWRFIFGLAIDESGLRAPHRSVLHVLRSFTPGSSWAVSTIAHRAGVARTSASKILADLASWGWLFIEHSGEEGRRSGAPSKYRLGIPLDQPPDRLANRRMSRVPVADCDTYLSQIATPVSQIATPPVADCDTRFLGSQVPCKAPTTAKRVDVSDADPRWLRLVHRIEEKSPQVKGPTRRLAADVIAEVHGYGVDDDTLALVMERTTEHLRNGASPTAALAQTLGRTEHEVNELRRVHHGDGA